MLLRRLTLLVLLLAGRQAAALPLPERPSGRVSDYAGALDGAARERLERQIAQATAGRSLQIAVAIFPSLDGGSLEDVSIKLAEKWKIGGKSSDDGVLLTVFIADRKLRIEVGYGLEGVLPDVRASRIVREVISPRLRAGDLEGGLREGLAAIVAAVGGEGAPTGPQSTREASPGGRPLPWWLPLAALGGVVLVVLIAVGSRRSRGGWSGGSRGWAQQAGSSMLWSLLWSFLFNSRRGGGGWGGGGGGGWGGGGGGGGFSGGGGSFGGGGASGSW